MTENHIIMTQLNYFYRHYLLCFTIRIQFQLAAQKKKLPTPKCSNTRRYKVLVTVRSLQIITALFWQKMFTGHVGPLILLSLSQQTPRQYGKFIFGKLSLTKKRLSADEVYMIGRKSIS